MKTTAAQSVSLKRRFKNHFAARGVDSPLPPALREESQQFPLKYREAVEEFQKYGDDA